MLGRFKLGVAVGMVLLAVLFVQVPAMAASDADAVLNRITRQKDYQSLLERLCSTGLVQQAEVDSFARAVVEGLLGRKLTAANFQQQAKEVLQQVLPDYPQVAAAVMASLSEPELAAVQEGQLPAGLKTLADLFKEELLQKQPPASSGGGGSGGSSSSSGGSQTGTPSTPGNQPDGNGTAVDFTDLAGHWAAAEIKALAGRGLITGKGGGLFAPEQPVTRAEFATLLVRLLGLQAPAASLPYQDVRPGDWYYGYLVAAVQSGIMRGVSDDRIAPNQPINREQLATMLMRALAGLGVALPAQTELKFSDRAKISAWAAAGVSQAVQLGLLRGYPDGAFRPGAPASRAEAAVILYRAMSHLTH